MNAAQTITAALLDSSVEAFMKDYMQKHPVRWEFIPNKRLPLRFLVARWTFEGEKIYLGSIKRTYPENWEILYKIRKSDNVNVPYSAEDQFSTKEDAARRLWELYNEE
jgi:hypothetical protein